MNAKFTIYNILAPFDLSLIDSETDFDKFKNEHLGDATGVFEFDVADDIVLDIQFGIIPPVVLERIELLRILDEYVDESEEERFKSEIIDRFVEQNSAVIVEL